MTRYTLAECQAKLPGIAVLAAHYFMIDDEFERLWNSGSPEDRNQVAKLNELQGKSYEKLWDAGCRVVNPEAHRIHFDGHVHGEMVTYCWEAGEDTISHGHWPGEVCDSRRELDPRFGWPKGERL